MSRKIKVVVIGNCQARPIAQLLPILNPKIEVTTVLIVHLLKSDDYEKHERYLNESDFIFTQLVAENYPCNFVRTAFLESSYPGKLVKLINLYFRGYSPDWRYVRLHGAPTLSGPLGDYHNQTLLNAWRLGKSVSEATEMVEDVEYNFKKYGSTLENSLKELSAREVLSDTSVVDYIFRYHCKKRLFFTFNHPTILLIEHMVKSSLVACQLSGSIFNFSFIKKKHEALDQFVLPINSYAREKYYKALVGPGNIKGRSCAIDKGRIVLGRAQEYKWLELIGSFFNIYDQFSSQLNNKDYYDLT